MTRAFDPERHCGALRRSDDLKGPGRKGQPCRQFKGYGTDHPGFGHCSLHGGSTPTQVEGAARERLTRELATMGIPVQIDPQQALLEQVWEAAGNVAFLRAAVQRLRLPGAVAGSSPAPEGESPAEVTEIRLYGPDHTGDAVPHVLVAMYGAERERLAKFAKFALDAGIAQKHLDLIERLADPIVAVVMAALEGLPTAEREQRQRRAAATGRHR
jgi:hypothetical protein